MCQIISVDLFNMLTHKLLYLIMREAVKRCLLNTITLLSVDELFKTDIIDRKLVPIFAKH
jgi:hypothetical protein